MMTREELEAALGDWTTDTPPMWEVKATVINAARRQLALMPEKCGTCIATPGTVDVIYGFADCPTCHGSGKVYPPETVKKIAKALMSIDVIVLDGLMEQWAYEIQMKYRRRAVFVLDALGETEWGPDHPSYDEMGQ